MKIIVSNELQIFNTPDALFRKIRATFTLRNPEYDAAEKMGRWTGNLDEYLRFYAVSAGTVTIPRGAIGLLLFFCKEMGIRPEIIDRRRTLQEVNFTFAGMRGEGITETCQCEALPPDTLAQIVKAAVQEYIDDGQYALDRYMEEQERAHLIEKLQMLAA